MEGGFKRGYKRKDILREEKWTEKEKKKKQRSLKERSGKRSLRGFEENGVNGKRKKREREQVRGGIFERKRQK